MMADWEDDEEIKRLREYLMIPSVHPDPDYGPCVSFLQQQAEELELETAVHELVANKPIVVISWTGTEPDLDAILLNSHMDVVPVYEEQWTHPPFAAEISEGWIYARGIQDMKAVGMIHLEAVRRLKMAGVRLKRTVHVSFVPDEEIGGEAGMQTFADTETFKAMNVGFEMDESAPHHLPDHVYAFYGERTVRSIKVTSRGSPSHGSFLPEDTAAEKLHYVIGKFLEFREEEKKKLEGIPDPTERLGEVTTVNLTMLEGGQQVNVIPDSLSASFDVRVTPYLPCDDFEEMVKSWCNEAGEGVTFEYIQKGEEIRSTEMDDVPFFDALKKVMDDRGIKINPVICAGSTDARWVRKKGIPALNLTPIVNSPLLLHAHDERLHVEEYKKGIDLMENILEAIANV